MYGDHRDLHVLTHSFPTRRPSDLNFLASLIAALVIPGTRLMTSAGMLRGGVSANLMSLGALDFGLIVDGAVIIVENALRRLAERQHHKGRLLDIEERLSVVAASAREMIRPSVYGQAIIILVYAPLLTFTGTEGKMFEPMRSEEPTSELQSL